MTKIAFLLITIILIIFSSSCRQNQSINKPDAVPTEEENEPIKAEEINTLSNTEKEEGWILLFDGKTPAGWRGAYLDSFPQKGWEITEGILSVVPSGGAESSFGGDIVTVDQFSSFELTLEFLLTEGANSGIKYFVVEEYPKPEGSALGLEYQILDDNSHPDAKMGKDGNRTLASLYDLIPAKNKVPRPVGEWNTARLLVKGNNVEHWLNGDKVLEYQRGSDDFKTLVAESKYKNFKNFGEAPKGHILLQDHGDKVMFRNIKLKVL